MKQAKPKIKLKSKNSSKNSNTSTIQKGGLPKRGIGTAGIAFYQDLLNKLQPFELRWPQSMRTFDAMKNDDAIASILNITYTLVENAFTNYSIKYKKSSEKSKRAAEYLEFCLQSMDQQTFIQTVRNAQTYKEKGFSILEKIFKRVDNGGQYQGMWKISQLANRPQNSLDMSTPFEINAGGRRLVSARQNTQYFKNYFNNNLFIDPKDMADQRGRGYKTIPRKKFILFGDGATDTVPFGTPLFRSCYKAWKEKVLLEDLEVNGASKDLAGIIELAIPQEILDIAQNDPSSPEAQMVEDLLTSAANVHAGEQSYFIRPSDVQENATSMTDYSIKLLGLEGNGRQFSPGEMIQQRRKAIYDIWGAGHILTGEGSVSYNSAEVKNSIHLQYIKKDINVIEEGYNTDLIPQLLNDLNEFDLEHDELPKICAGEIDKASFDEVFKNATTCYLCWWFCCY